MYFSYKNSFNLSIYYKNTYKQGLGLHFTSILLKISKCKWYWVTEVIFNNSVLNSYQLMLKNEDSFLQNSNMAPQGNYSINRTAI